MEEDAPTRRPINTRDARSESAVAPVAPINPPRGQQFSVNAPGLRKSTEDNLPPRTSYIIEDNEEKRDLGTKESEAKWGEFNAELDRIEREDREIRIRLSNLYNDGPELQSASRTNQQYEEDLLPRPTQSKSYKQTPPMFDVTLLESAPSELQLERSKEALLVNSIAENVLTKLVDDVFIEAENIMGEYVDQIYQEELNGMDEFSAISIIASSMMSSRSQSTMRNQATLNESQATAQTITELELSESRDTETHSIVT
ncbi:Oidioi.mRNA.OKI2018_I69.chr1.g2771.t1.cds [Oikopleura dioica]|uniref:Oidioi.mRNA.OKI2018_I69.chr1.g2771.t1.cds n=1 Tax=Oikopleura dioica TaxID=34765 RepID=A0ABN7SS17_OIKDI|nr:Oidioi.mRNA.OKI2018_I69.chr1.g2771.t1.cds [Oikopleura dioica]